MVFLAACIVVLLAILWIGGFVSEVTDSIGCGCATMIVLAIAVLLFT
jgi:hypothetical protein